MCTTSYNSSNILGEVEFITVPTFYMKTLTPGKVKWLTLAHIGGKDSSQVALMQLHSDASLNAVQDLTSQTQPSPQTVYLLKGIFTVQRLDTSLFLGPPPVLVAPFQSLLPPLSWLLTKPRPSRTPLLVGYLLVGLGTHSCSVHPAWPAGWKNGCGFGSHSLVLGSRTLHSSTCFLGVS